LTTRLSIFRNFRNPGGGLGGSFTAFLSSAFDCGFSLAITPPPARLEYSTSAAFRRRKRGQFGNAQHRSRAARYSGTIVHQGI
jgi:hypothetical protein